MIVEAVGLTKTFKVGKAGTVEALRGIDLSVAEGEILGLLGPNGAGKTTTINALTTLLRPDSGSVHIAGIDALARPADVRPLIGLTGQFAAVDGALTARENLELFGRLFQLSKADAAARATALLDEFEVVRCRRPATFSGGMRRRLDLAASMIGDPQVLFLDEPTTGLDPRSRTLLWDIVRRLRDGGMTIILTTQYLEEADQLADRIVVIDKGSVIAQGTPDQLKELVGGSVCEVEVAPTDADAAAWILGEHWTVTLSGESMTVPAPDASTIVDVIRLLDENTIPVGDIGLRHPTLDDVFLALTGDVADRDEADAEPVTAEAR